MKRERLQLTSGRVLGYREFGSRSGAPIFHFHGIAGSSIEAALFGCAPTVADVRLVCIDRPGLGASEFQAGRKVLDWPQDVSEVANQLGIEKFAVSGVSGGTPYALACAYKLPTRVLACGIVSGAGPAYLMPPKTTLRYKAFYYGVHKLPRVYQAIAKRVIAGNQRDALRSFQTMAKLLSAADRKVVHHAELGPILAQTSAEGSSQGSNGPILEGQLLTGDWGFKINEIAGPKLFFWHGEEDAIVPVAIARGMAQALPAAKVQFYGKEGHYSVMANCGAEILTTLATAFKEEHGRNANHVGRQVDKTEDGTKQTRKKAKSKMATR